ncbi:MAG: MarR family winged helix-turn-helix transcriptional regulator [Deltaproteobacteria bacterium]|nr:MarR family winged helix-turn-helix transcriptional regulator [Deltaproteobacteria bacterium]
MMSDRVDGGEEGQLAASSATLEPTPNYGVLEECIGYNLRIAYAFASQLFAQDFDGQDLAPIQFAALEFIAHNPDLSQRQIAAHIGTTPTVLVKPLERLESMGLVTRTRSVEDRRRSRVRLTEEGGAFLNQARPRILQVEDRLTANLSKDEREMLLRLVRKLLEVR